VYSCLWEAIECHLLHGVTLQTHEPCVNPSQAGSTQFVNPRGLEGWLNLASC